MQSGTFNTWNWRYSPVLSVSDDDPLSRLSKLSPFLLTEIWPCLVSNNHASHSQNVWFDSPPEQECRHWVVFIWKNCEECFLTKFPNEIRTLISGRVKAADSKQFQHWRKWRLWWWLSGYVTWSMTEFPIARLPARLLVAGILVIINTDRIRTAVTRPLDFLILIETGGELHGTCVPVDRNTLSICPELIW